MNSPKRLKRLFLALRLHRRHQRHRVLRLQVGRLVVQALQPRVDKREDLHFAQETSQWKLIPTIYHPKEHSNIMTAR